MFTFKKYDNQMVFLQFFFFFFIFLKHNWHKLMRKADITKHSLCVTCGSQWSVKCSPSSWRAIMCNPMQPDRFLNRILIGFCFFLEGKCQNLILSKQNHFKRGVRYCFEIKLPARRKAIRLPLPSYINFSPLTAIFS